MNLKKILSSSLKAVILIMKCLMTNEWNIIWFILRKMTIKICFLCEKKESEHHIISL